MKNDTQTDSIPITGPKTQVELTSSPGIGRIFAKALWLGLIRGRQITDNSIFKNTCLVLKNQIINEKKINPYNKICGFEIHDTPEIPISYFQTLFTGILGKFITSSAFPINPLGLVHIFQSLEIKQTITPNESVDLSCDLTQVSRTLKGIEYTFTLTVESNQGVVWEGVSIFLTPIKRAKKKEHKKQDSVLPHTINFLVPSNTGRAYASVSNDYNPHHLSSLLAKLFGFKKAIAHGMWSLSKVLSELNKTTKLNLTGTRVEAWFKRPIFMPATVILGHDIEVYEPGQIKFDLRDEKTNIPHLKGQILFNSK